MKTGKLIGSYLFWHYKNAWGDMFGIFRNFLWFLYHFFSIPLLSKTLFSPWKRLHEEKKRGFNLEETFSRLLINIIMRMVGFIARASLLMVGFFSILVFLLFSVIIFCIWAFIPLFIFILIYDGIIFFFT